MNSSSASRLSRSSSICCKASRTAHSAHLLVAGRSRPNPRRSSSLPSRIPTRVSSSAKVLIRPFRTARYTAGPRQAMIAALLPGSIAGRPTKNRRISPNAQKCALSLTGSLACRKYVEAKGLPPEGFLSFSGYPKETLLLTGNPFPWGKRFQRRKILVFRPLPPPPSRRISRTASSLRKALRTVSFVNPESRQSSESEISRGPSPALSKRMSKSTEQERGMSRRTRG